MTAYSELRENLKKVRLRQGVGLLAESNRAPRIRRKALSFSRGFIFAMLFIYCASFWLFVVLWTLGGK